MKLKFAVTEEIAGIHGIPVSFAIPIPDSAKFYAIAMLEELDANDSDGGQTDGDVDVVRKGRVLFAETEVDCTISLVE